ncbi:MAG: Flp pilus assembly complex ATPase component TadA [Alcaligenaceae bacterium]|nr:Flp pilus assembly complex ATPase component TadA [Alcaligenaceae bacterium]
MKNRSALRAPWRWKRPVGLDLSEPLPQFDPSSVPVLANPDDLACLRPAFVRTLTTELDIPVFDGRWAPVLFDNETVGIFAVAEYVASDPVDALVRHVLECGHVLASPVRYVVSPSLLLSIVRGQSAVQSDALRTGSMRPVPSHAGMELASAFQDIVVWGVRQGASDIHLNVNARNPESEVRFSLSGRYLAPSRFHRISTSMLQDMLGVAWMDVRGGNGAIFDPSIEQQGSLVRRVDDQDILLRWSSLSADAGPSVCLRILHRDQPAGGLSLERLGYLPDQLEVIERVLRAEGGAIVFAGTVGSGKSTSLAALMARLPNHRKLISLEDPVEYLIPGAIQVTLARSLNVSAHDDFAAKLRTLKRSGMTDVLLGEVRDAETGRAFMDLVGSGVNLYTTVHAPSAIAIPDRLASDFIGVSRDFLAMRGAFRMLVYQALLPVLCSHCALPAMQLCQGSHTLQGRSMTSPWWGEWLARIGALYDEPLDRLKIRNPAGCAQCLSDQDPALSGYRGRTVVAEIIEPVLGLHRDRSAMACAVHKAFQGLIDPRDIEPRFHAFETEHLRRTSTAAHGCNGSAA